VRDIIVIGASAGGIEALKVLISALPAGFQAAIFIVLHVSPDHASILPEILSKQSRVPVQFAENGIFLNAEIFTLPRRIITCL
jgi:two-component system chemotaxis response regulator CheB